MYGLVTYGESSYGATRSEDNSAFIAAIIVPEFSASLAVGASATIDATLFPVAMFGADSTPRTATINVESGIQANFSSTIPVYAIGLIAPLVSASIFGSTTVSGTISSTVQPVAVIYGISPNPITFSAIIRVRPSIVGYTDPAGVISAQIRTVSAIRLLAVPFIKFNAVVPSYAEMTGIAGVTNVLSVTIRPVFSASAAFGIAGAFSSAIRPICSFLSSTGNALLADIEPLVEASIFGGAYQYAQGNILAIVPIVPGLRGTFGDQVYPETIYVTTRQQIIVVRQ